MGYEDIFTTTLIKKCLLRLDYRCDCVFFLNVYLILGNSTLLAG